MKKGNIDLDNIIKKSIQAKADEIKVPPKEEVWSEIMIKLASEKEKTRKRKLRYKIAIASIAFILSMGMTPWLFPNHDAAAVGKRLVRIFQSVFGGETNVEHISREVSPPSNEQAPPEGEVTIETVQSPQPAVFESIAKAREEVPFVFKVPGYMPEGYKLERVIYSGFKEETGEVTLHYKLSNSEILIIEKKLPGDFAISENIKTGDAEVHELDINGQTGTLTSFTNGHKELEYYLSGFSLRISGQIDEWEIVKIAKSMQ